MSPKNEVCHIHSRHKRHCTASTLFSAIADNLNQFAAHTSKDLFGIKLQMLCDTLAGLIYMR